MEDMRSQLKRGDRVMVAGIIGEVSKIQADTVILKMVEGAKIEVLREAILEVYPKGVEKSLDKKEEAEES
jgi:preprotein translocase subunit YajC